MACQAETSRTVDGKFVSGKRLGCRRINPPILEPRQRRGERHEWQTPLQKRHPRETP
jgi:hypothetical protein